MEIGIGIDNRIVVEDLTGQSDSDSDFDALVGLSRGIWSV